jgi:serine phosphatase RsbU (regulator of sigma subunit)
MRTLRPQFRPVSVVVMVIGLVGTGLLVWAVHTTDQHNEQRLLALQTRQAGLALGAAVPDISSPLATAASIAAVTGGDVQKFAADVEPLVAQGRSFDSVSLWRLAASGPVLVTLVGSAPDLRLQPARLTAALQRARGPGLDVVDLLGQRPRHIGFALSAPPSPPVYVVYAEWALSGRRVRAASGSAFSDLDFTIYLGTAQRRADLIGASPAPVPPSAPTSRVTVPFGDSALTLIAAARAPLAGGLSGQLPWLLAVAGVLVTVAAAAAAERLDRRRNLAELLAAENRRLYGEQRGIAEELQRSILPEELPEVPGLVAKKRYIAGAAGLDVGGDWCDLVPLADERVFFAVGDVSGRGLDAAKVMASLHFAIRAYATQGDPPAEVLSKLAQLVSLGRDGHFATVVCGIADVVGHQVTIANAGHFPPLLVGPSSAEFLRIGAEVPIGVEADRRYGQTVVTVPAGATLLMFTDGLVERRGEDLQLGLGRLQDAAREADQSLDDLLDHVVARLIPRGSEDDAALLGIRWRR